MPEPLAKKVTREERRDRVMKLARGGASTRAIARRLGISHATAARDINARLQNEAEHNPTTVAYREMMRQRLERQLQQWWVLSLSGNGEAADRVLRIIDRQAKLLGLDVPVPKDATLRLETPPAAVVHWNFPQPDTQECDSAVGDAE